MIEAHAEGCVISVRAQPGARKNGIVGIHNGNVKVAVTAPADKGRANDALVEILAEAFNVKRSQVELISGPTHRDKKFLIRGTQCADVERRVDELTSKSAEI